MSKSDLFIASILALFSGLIFYPLASLGADPHHDGIMLKPALDVLSGQLLFRDTFSQYGPLTTYLHAMALGIQPTLLSLRLLTVAAYAGSLFFLYLSWRSLLPRSLALVASLLFIVYLPYYGSDGIMSPWSSVLALLFQSVAVWALLRILDGRTHAAWAWTLGMSCACTLWCRQPVGIILSGSIGVIAVALHRVGWRSPGVATWQVWMRVCTGFTVISVLILGHLAINGALGAWWVQTILWPQRWAIGVDKRNFPYLSGMFLRLDYAVGLLGLLLVGVAPAIIRRIGASIPRWLDFAWLGLLGVACLAFHIWDSPWMPMHWGGWNVLVLGGIGLNAVLVLAPFISRSRRAINTDYYKMAALTGVALGSAAQIYPIPCAQHIYWALAPGLGLFIYLCWRWSRTEVWVCCLVMVSLLLPAVYGEYCSGRDRISDQTAITLGSPPVLKGMRVDPNQAQALQRIDAVLQPLLAANPDRLSLLYGNDALYLTWFKSGPNPVPYYVNWANLLTRDEQRIRLIFLIEKQPVLFLHNQPNPGVVEKFLRAVNYKVVHKEPELGLMIALPCTPEVLHLTP